MAFCKYCGKQLEENQLCDCEKAVASRQPVAEAAAPAEPAQATAPAEPAQAAAPVTAQAAAPVAPQPAPQAAPQQPNENLEKAKDAAKSTWKSILGILKAPATEGKAFVQNGDNISAYIILALQAIVASIFACVIIGKINDLIGLAGSYLQSIKFSGFTAFVVTFLYSAILSVVMAGALWCGLKILKINVDFNKAIRVVAVRTVGVLPVMILSIIFFALNVSFGIAVFVLSAVLGLCFFSAALNGVEELNGNKKTYLVFALILVYVIVYALIASKGFTLYIPETLKTYLGQISSLPDLLSSFGSLY